MEREGYLYFISRHKVSSYDLASDIFLLLFEQTTLQSLSEIGIGVDANREDSGVLLQYQLIR